MENESLIGRISLTNQTGNHNKQYIIEVKVRPLPGPGDNALLYVSASWGRIGGTLRSQVKWENHNKQQSPSACGPLFVASQVRCMKAAVNTLVRLKVKKGYRVDERWWSGTFHHNLGNAPWGTNTVVVPGGNLAKNENAEVLRGILAERQLAAEW
jgi:predicted DNA-binding WGR domain protein